MGLALLAFLYGCKGSKADYSRLRFKVESRCPVTPVKSQGRSSSCWIYAMLATLESHRLAIGDSVNLSPDFFERKALEEEGQLTISERKSFESVRIRGMLPHLMTLWTKHGAFAFNSYRKKDDGTFGLVPLRQYFMGADYSPHEFARSVALAEDYEFLGCDRPFPDRRETDRIVSCTPDEMLRQTVASLRRGFAVAWEGDTSEDGFNWRQGVADCAYNPESYLTDIDKGRTTDDHCMAIIGIARDNRGKRYLICKNSWGRGNAFRGLLMMSFDYFRAKTILVSLYKKQAESVKYLTK